MRRQVDGEALVNVKGDQILTRAKSRLTIVGIVRRAAPGTLVVRNAGQLETWQASLENGQLHLGRETDVKVFRRVLAVPPEAELQPVVTPLV